jgi:hypothetical protein
MYTECVYQPMLEVLVFLRANGFKTFIVSGGGAEFMRVWAEKVYGIPPEQVVGTMFKVTYDIPNDRPTLTIRPDVVHNDDKAGRPVGIHQLIGRRPVACFGNSDGDVAMLQWTTVGRRPSFGLIVHYTDAEREWAYDANPKSSGRLVEGLAEAPPPGMGRGGHEEGLAGHFPVPEVSRPPARRYSHGLSRRCRLSPFPPLRGRGGSSACPAPPHSVTAPLLHTATAS